MSFITKRERVFNEYDLFELPARNEGKLKAYSSCTDARAWSHFCSDKSDHLVEIIKRNNETRKTKYVPTEAIVNTLLAHKHAEISRLKRKIEEFEQMLAAYDELELTCEQKCEIAKAHAAIKEANKDLNELWFDLDLSGFTGVDSEDFETGKTRGDEPSAKFRDRDAGDESPVSKGGEWSFEKEPLKESKGNQAGEETCGCDASTNAVDPRIEQLQECIIGKDAKINAMKNTLAVVENDVCEPYCIYAHIYTALEKIFGILCQNDKYKLYLSLMTAGKDTRCIDIKGKILFKLKVLEKFNLALISPCSQNYAVHTSHNSEQECACYRAEVTPRIETAFALTSAENQPPCLDNKRAQLVADIMESEEMKEILNRDNKTDNDTLENVNYCYNIDKENIQRLKNLQENYDDLMNCYETLKHEKDCLQIKCEKYEDLEKELESLKAQLREYNTLWTEKEHYRKRSLDLDALKEQYLVLCDETTSLETELKAENEINDVKAKTIEDLRSDNISLEKKLNEAAIAFEKENNYARCKLKESECTIMCQGQQIKSLSLQIDRLLERDPEQSNQAEAPSIAVIDELNLLREQIKNLKDALFCSEEEKQQLQEEYQNKLNLINDLKMELEDWKTNYEKTMQRNDYLEKYAVSFGDEVNKLFEDNKVLAQANDNLNDMVNKKCQEVSKLMEEIEHKNKETSDLYDEMHSLHDTYDDDIKALDTEKSHVIRSLQIANQESHELLKKVKDYDDLSNSCREQTEEINRLKSLLISTQQENESLQMDLLSRNNKNSILLQEVQRLQDISSNAVNNISALQESLELTKKDSKVMEDKLHSYENISRQLKQLQESHAALLLEKNKLEHELANKSFELNNTIHAIHLTKKKSEELEGEIQITENLKEDLIKEQQRLQAELNEKKKGFDKLLQSFNDLKNNLNQVADESSLEIDLLSKELASLRKSYNELLNEKNVLQNDAYNKTEEINNLCNNLENKIEENRVLVEQLQLLEDRHKNVQDSMTSLQDEHYTAKSAISTLRKESDELLRTMKYYQMLELKYNELKKEHDQVKGENNKLQEKVTVQIAQLKRIKRDNEALNSESQHLLSHSEDLENALINARTELIDNTSSHKSPNMEIIKEIEIMKRENISNHKKIRDLLDKLDDSENVISDLQEGISARDDRISALQNHINELQEEVRKLHISLEEIVNTGEQIKDNSYQKINQSLDTMEAHYSKATHNMKLELAKLRNDNMSLEGRLSISKIKSDDSARDKHKYVSQIIHLQNEREIIVTDIKQLEMKSVGDSALSPHKCDVEDILASLDRIRKYLDARSSKSISLEQTLLKVQNSYQVVQNKADEAKKIVEKEKQKILSEKEEAIREKINMETQLSDLKEQLEQQISHDQNVIKDLEAEILNQKLIFDKLKNSTQNYISKLKEEMQALQDLYQKALEKGNELENKVELMRDEENTHLDIIKKVNSDLEDKSKEIDALKTELEMLKNKPNRSIGSQPMPIKNRDQETQTIEEIQYEGYEQYDDAIKIKSFDENNDLNTNKSVFYDRKINPKDNLKHINEVQVLTANVEPTFDYVKNSYLNYKLKHLSPGRIEQYSIACSDEDMEINKYSENPTANQSTENMNVINIYNKESMHTNSSKVIGSNSRGNEKDFKGPGKTSANTGFGLIIGSLDTKSSNKASHLFESGSGVSLDNDLFVIYKDSVTNKSNDKKPWPKNGRSEVLPKTTTIHPYSQKQTKANDTNKSYDIENDFYALDEELMEDDGMKHKLNINVPRVETGSPTVDTTSEGDKKSLDSYTMHMFKSPYSSHPSSEHKIDKKYKPMSNNLKSSSLHSLSYDEPLYMESNFSTEDENLIRMSKKKSDIGKVNKDNLGFSPGSAQKEEILNDSTAPGCSSMPYQLKKESHHRLSRIDADVRLIKIADPAAKESKIGKDIENFGLDYILANVEVKPNNNLYNIEKSLRKTRSDERFDINNIKKKDDLSASRISDVKNSTGVKTLSSDIQSSYNSPSKTFTERSVMVMLEPAEEYEKKIKNLTENLENIEKDYRKKIEAIKIQYDRHIKSIINEHNKGVKNIQCLHEETLQDIKKHHENEVENLRSMSMEAMRKVDKLEKEVRTLKCKMPVCSTTCLKEDPIKMSTHEIRKHRRPRLDTKTLTKTNVEAYNVRPKSRSNWPCTCSLDINISDTIRNIFEQVDVEQRKIAEHSYLKYIANKILSNNVEALDCQELSFLHLKVCRIWKVKLSKEEVLQKRIDSLEAELMNKQRHTQYNMAELDRKVAEERRRLQEVREAVCRSTPNPSKYDTTDTTDAEAAYVSSVPLTTADATCLCSCSTGTCNLVGERRSAGDLVSVVAPGIRQKRVKTDANRAVLAKLDTEERREKKLYNDEPPTRLRRPHDRLLTRTNKK